MSQAKKTYYCVNAVRHDKKRYAAGEPIELTEADAKSLLELSAITKHDPKRRVDAEADANKRRVDAAADEKAKAEADAQAKAEADAKAKADADAAKEKAAADEKAKADADAKAKGQGK